MIPDEMFWTQADAIAALKAEDFARFKVISAVVGSRERQRIDEDQVRALLAAGWLPFVGDGEA